MSTDRICTVINKVEEACHVIINFLFMVLCITSVGLIGILFGCYKILQHLIIKLKLWWWSR